MADVNSSKIPGRVVIGCKLPHGLHLDAPTVAIKNDRGEVIDGGTRDLSRRITLKGTNSLTIKDSGFILPESGHYGVTELLGEQVEMWRDWYARHRDYPPVKNGLIFEAPTMEEAKKEGLSRAEVKNGAERIDPEKLPRGIKKADK